MDRDPGARAEGPLSPRLHDLNPGDKVLLAPKGAGFFTLADVPQNERLWLLSTGTALGPFLSICKTEEPWRRFKKLVLCTPCAMAMN